VKDLHIKDFVRAVGPRVAHVTAVENLPMIRTYGLMSAHAAAQAIGLDPEDLALRRTRVRLSGNGRSARLNHQRPILHGLAAADRLVEGHSARSWAETLDQRVFLWPEAKGHAFRESIKRDLATAMIWLDSRRLADALFDAIDLSPLNSGNFTQGGAHARRGDWVFVPLSAGLMAFRENRRRRGLVKARDSVREISLRRGIPPNLLADLEWME